MAISKTVFSGTTAATNAAEVESWLIANGTDYFLSVENIDNVITCNVIGGGQLIIRPKQREWQVLLDNGTSLTIDHYGAYDGVSAAFVTSKGIALFSDPMWIFIAKSNNNTIGIVCYQNSNWNSLHFADFSTSVSFKNDSNNIKQTEMGVTSLCICPFGMSGNYADGLYCVPFYEYSQKGVITVPMTGKSYVYSGYIALEE